MTVATGVLMALLLAQAAVPAATAPAAQPEKGEPAKTEAVTPAKAETPKKVCVQETQLGSHFKTRICATPKEWERRRERDAEVLLRGSDRPTQ